ncbi:MAG: DNA-binding protein, partial [Methylococcales bacterium]|nr:DNA-binding protein [Methylococcales bacterium]
MARAGVTYLEVTRAAETIQQQGQNPTVDRVLAHLGTGSKSTLGPLLKRWKSENAGTADTGKLPDDVLMAVKDVHDRLQQDANDTIKQAEDACAATVAELQTQISQAARTSEQLKTQNLVLEEQLKTQQADNQTLRRALERAHIEAVKQEVALSHTTTHLTDTKAALKEQKQENQRIQTHFEHYQTSVAEDRQQDREQFH